MTGQLSLRLPLDSAHQADQIFEVPTQHQALNWLKIWPQWPGPLTILYGPEKCGKTHLSHYWQMRSQAGRIRGGDPLLPLPQLLAQGCTWVMEEAHLCPDETWFFHFYNLVQAQGGSLLCTAPLPPAQWGIKLPDLRSRLYAAMAIGIPSPDDETLQLLLQGLLAQRALRISEEVMHYLTARMERSYTALHYWVEVLDHQALKLKRPLTVPFLRDVMGVTT